MARQVAITGFGTVNPCGNDVASTWNAMCEARSGTGRVTAFDVTDAPCQVAGEVKGFDGEALFGRKGVRRMGRFVQFAIAAADEAGLAMVFTGMRHFRH